MTTRLTPLFILLVLSLLPGAAMATTTITLQPDGTGTSNGDAFVTTGPSNDLTGNNYGGAGALAVSAALSKGTFDSLLRFDLSSAASSLNTTYGVGGWNINSISLQLTTATVNNALFNASQTGTFDVSLISSNSWTEGTGNPNTPTTTGVKWTDMSGLLSGAQSLGAFNLANVGDGVTASYTLTPSSTLLSDLFSGGQASFALTADPSDSTVAAFFNSRNFGTASRRPALIITASATPEPGRAMLFLIGAACTLGRRRKPVKTIEPHRMKKRFIIIAAVLCPVLLPAADSAKKQPVRVAVIGGMTLGGMWPELAEKFTQDTGWPVELVATGPKAVLAQALKGGLVDLVTLHSSDEATEMVANGFAKDMQPWARNEHCIMGPADDPAGIRGMKDGAEALKKIAQSQSPFVDFMGPGSREVSHRLWKAAGEEPKGNWVLKDESKVPQAVVEYAASKKAYVIVGRIPILKGKIPSAGMVVMVQGDPAMRRPYVVMVADEKKFPQSNQPGSKALHAWMTGEAGQSFLRDYSTRKPDEPHLFYPALSELVKP